MKSNKSQQSLRSFGVSLWSFFLCVNAAEAQANNGHQHDDVASRAQLRAELRGFRDTQRDMRGQRTDLLQPIAMPGTSVPAPGEPISPPPILHGAGGLVDTNAMSRRAVPSVSQFRTTRPERVLNRTTYTNDSGKARTLHQGVSLDLTSTDANITVGSKLLGDATATIKVGDVTKMISAGSKVTAAEYAALNQALVTGSQGLTLNSDGAAVDGSLNLGVVSDNGRTINTSELVIPASVEVAGDFGRHADGVRVTNDLVNYGSLYAVSSKRGKDTAVIAARDVNNFESGLITTNAPDAVAQQLGAKNDNLSLAVRADRNLNNAGEISSAGDLELSAGNSLTNSGLASATGNVALNSSSINNSGAVSAANGNINLTSAVDANLNVDATGGAFSALNGDINVATTPGANVKTNTTLTGGDWHASEMNITSGDGLVHAKVGDVTAMVNVTAGVISFNAVGDKLTTGVMKASGDPLFSNTGDVFIGADIFTDGAPLSIIAGGNIIAGLGVSTIATFSNSFASGGEILMIAGAQYTTNPTTISVTGGTTGGGSVILPGVLEVNSSGGLGNAGDVTILAFEGTNPVTGQIDLSNAQIEATGLSDGGDVLLMAEGTGLAITVGGPINTNAPGDAGGSVTMYNSQITVIDPYQIFSTPGPTEGGRVPGTGGANPGALSAGSINFGDVTLSGNNFLNVVGAGTIFGGNVNAFADNSSPYIEITSFGATGTLNILGIATTSSFADGGYIQLGANTLTAGNLSTNGLTSTGNITLSSTGIVTVGQILNDAGFSGSSGFINITSDGGINLMDNVITNGDSAGDITFSTTGTLQTFGSTISAHGLSSAGDIVANVNDFIFNGGVNFINGDFAQNGNVSLFAPGGFTAFSGNFYINAGNNIVLSSTPIFNNNYGGFIDWRANQGNLTTNFTMSMVANNIPGGISLIAGNTLTVGGISMVSTSNASVDTLYVEANSINVGSLNTINTNSAFVDGNVTIILHGSSNYSTPTVIAGDGNVTVIKDNSGNIDLSNLVTAGTLHLEAASGNVNIITIPTVSGVEWWATNGTVELYSSLGLTMNPFPTGNGGNIDIRANNLATTSSTFTLFAGTPTGAGGSIYLDVDQVSTRLIATATGGSHGGSIHIATTTPSLIDYGAINASGNNGDGGSIVITNTNGVIRFFDSILANGTANGGTINISTSTGNSVDFINAANVSATGNLIGTAPIIMIDAHQVNLQTTTPQMNVFTASGSTQSSAGILITANVLGGQGQNVQLTSSSDISLLSNVNLTGVSSAGGDLTMNAGLSVIMNPLATINLTVVTADPAGTLSITANNDVTVGTVSTNTAFGAGGSVSITAVTGALSAGAITTTGGSSSGAVDLTAGNTLSVGNINASSSSGSGAPITLTAGYAISAQTLNAGGGFSGGGGQVSVSSGDSVVIGGTIGTSGNFSSGSVEIDATTSITVSGAINTANFTMSGGSVSLDAGTFIDTVGITTTGNLGGGAVELLAGSSIDVGTINTSSLSLSSGSVTLDANTDVTALAISATGAGGINSPVSITGSGVMNLASINSSSTNGIGGAIYIENTTGSSLIFAADSTLNAQSSTSAGGDVTIIGPNAVMQNLELIATTGATTNGDITIDISSIQSTGGFSLNASDILGGTGGVITVDTDATGGITSQGDPVLIRAFSDIILNLGTNGINADAQQVQILSSSGDINAASANIVTTNADVIVQTTGSVAIGGINAGTGDVTLSSGDVLDVDGQVIADALSVAYASGTTQLSTVVSSLVYNASGGAIEVLQGPSNLSVSGQALTSTITVSGFGASLAVGTLTGHTGVNFAVSSGTINFTQPLDVGATGTINLQTVGGSITQTAGATLTAQTLSISMASTGNTVTLNEANSVGTLTTSGGTSTINFNNGSNALRIGGMGLNNTLNATTSSASGITLDSSISATFGNLNLTADYVLVDAVISVGSISFESNSGNLTVEGTAGSSLVGIFPTAGTPGNPSTPAAINISTAVGGNLSLVGPLSLSGDVFMDNTGGTTTSQNNSLFAGTNNITLKTDDWVQVGNGNITANNLILDLPLQGTIINTGGDVNLSGNITFLGHDLAILALGDIIITGNITIDLSNGAGNAGNLLMVAGWTFTTSSGGQQNTAAPFTFSTPAPSGGSIQASGASIITTSTGGNNGTVTAIANNGEIELGNIDTGGAAVTLVGEDGVNVGSIISNDVTVSASVPQLVGAGPFVVTAGTLTGGTFQASSTLTPGAISVGGITTTAGKVVISNGGSNIALLDEITGAQEIRIRSAGDVSLVGFDDLVANGNGLGGIIEITANDLVTSLAGPVTLQASGAVLGGATIQLTRLSNVDLSIGNDIVFVTSGTHGSYVDVQNDNSNVTVEAGSIDVNGTVDGGSVRIATNGILTLNSQDFLDVDGQSGNGDGGNINLNAGSVVTANGELEISANGLGTGSGGSIGYFTTDITPTFIGEPAKAPKPPFNLLFLSATAGAAGGSGGRIEIEVGGNLTANPANMNAEASSTGNNDGAEYLLTAGGSLIVTGDLDASGSGTGTGGTIRLESNNKKAFSFGTGKTPKNGVQGPITIDGVGGTLTVINNGGGVLVGQNVDIETINLTASIKGTIASGKGVTITGSALNLFADSGAIGKKPLITSVQDLTAIGFGAVRINNSVAGVFTVNDVLAGKGGFTLNNQGITNLLDIEVNSGDIEINSTNDIVVAASSEIIAMNGAISIVDSKTDGSIGINANAVIATDGDKGGEVIIAIGEAPKKGVTPLPDDSPDLVVTNIGKKGIAYYDGVVGGLQVIGTNNVVIAENKPVILSNPNTGGGTISLGGGVLIHADPPTGVKNSALPNFAINNVVAPLATSTSENLPSFGIVTPTILDQANSGTISNIGLGNATIATAQAGTLNSITSNGISSNGIAFGDVTNNGINSATAGDVLFGSIGSASASQAENDLFVDATFVTDKQAHHVLKNGNMVFAPQSDITVETDHGTLKIAARSVTVVTQSDAGLSVFNLDDHGKNAVVLQTHGKHISLTPGQHVTVSNHASEHYAEINAIELVQHRGLSKSRLNNGWKVYTSEFSIPSACYAVKPLRSLAASNDKEASKLRNHLMKTAAVIMMLRPDQGDFVQHFKPYTTAMK